MKNTSKSFIWFGIIAFIAIVAYQSYLKRNPIIKDVDEELDFVDNVENIVVEEPESEFLGNQLSNGESPFSAIYGEGLSDKNDNTLTIKNQSSSDVVVLLKRITDDKIIRNHYVQANSTFTIRNIPNATCYTKYYYGNDWNPNLMVKGVMVGGFDNNQEFVDTNEDIMKFEVYEEGNYIYSSEFQVTLETIITEGQTMTEKNVSASEFFN